MTIEIDEDNYAKEVENSNIPVIIDFFADWCGPCQMMKPVFESLSQKYIGKLKFAKVNTEVSPELAGKYDVQGIPCLVIIDKSNEIGRIIGYNNEAMLKQKIDSILK